MAYSKQNFRDGDILTAEQLNRMEEGILNAEGGTAGADGYSPTIDEQTTEDGVTLEITDKNGTKRVSVQNGKTPKIQVKAVTGDAGTEAKVEQSGTPEEPVIVFTIPKGDTGGGENLSPMTEADIDKAISTT